MRFKLLWVFILASVLIANTEREKFMNCSAANVLSTFIICTYILSKGLDGLSSHLFFLYEVLTKVKSAFIHRNVVLQV